MENIQNIEMISLTEDELINLNGGTNPVTWLLENAAWSALTHDGPGIPIQRYRDYY